MNISAGGWMLGGPRLPDVVAGFAVVVVVGGGCGVVKDSEGKMIGDVEFEGTEDAVMF